VAETIRKDISLKVDTKDGVITITTTSQDPLISKTIADSLRTKLKEFITAYRTDKARKDVAYYKKLTALRKNPEYSETVVYGKTIPYLPDVERLMAFERVSKDQTLLILGNFQTKAQTVKLPSKCKKVVLNNVQNVDFVSDTEIRLEGYQALVVEI